MRWLILLLLACSCASRVEPSPAAPGTVEAPRQAPTPSVATAPTMRAQLSSGYMQNCCVTSDHRVRCNGGNTRGEMDVPDRELRAVSAGLYMTCGIDTEGQPHCWGQNAPETPGQPGIKFTRIAAGDGFACALSTEGHVRCWNSDFAIPPAGKFVDLVAGDAHACALRDSGEVVCFGRPPRHPPMLCTDLENAESGRCQPEQEVPRDWTHPPKGLRAKLISAGADHSCALTPSGKVECWGAWGNGDGNTIWSNHLFPPNDLEPTIRQLTAGSGVSCALLESGKARCWGHQSELPGTFVAIESGATATCGVREGGELQCFAFSSFAGVKLDETALTCAVTAD